MSSSGASTAVSASASSAPLFLNIDATAMRAASTKTKITAQVMTFAVSEELSCFAPPADG